jgi:hypothetical protein
MLPTSRTIWRIRQDFACRKNKIGFLSIVKTYVVNATKKTLFSFTFVFYVQKIYISGMYRSVPYRCVNIMYSQWVLYHNFHSKKEFQ